MDGLHHLSIDIETYSDVEISKTGLYRYAQSPAFEVLLFGYSLDGAPPRVIDLARGEQIPPEIIQHCMSPYTLKHAYNAAFEWYCLSRFFGIQNLPGWLYQWRDTMLHSL